MSPEVSPAGSGHAEHRQYVRAPIVEAILQLSFADSESIPHEAIAPVVDALRVQYPERKELFGVAGEFKPAAHGFEIVSTERNAAGVQLEETGGHRLVRILTSAVSVHEVRPYAGWNAFRACAREVFSVYEAHMPPRTISRIGVRYVNRLELPADCGDLKLWVTSAPDIPEGLPQFVSTYAVEIAMPQPDLPATVGIMRQALLEVQDSIAVPIILDIELVSNAPVGMATAWDVIEMLHEREHLIFEHTITDRVRSLIA